MIIDFALDALPEADYAANDFAKLRIVYRDAVKPESCPEIRRAAVDGGQLFCICADGKACTMIELRR